MEKESYLFVGSLVFVGLLVSEWVYPKADYAVYGQ
jgi:hypothetical protein